MARCGCTAGTCSCMVVADNETTTCIDIAVTGNGASDNPFKISATPVVNPAAGNLLECGASGLLADLSVLDSNCVNLSGLGTNASPLTAELTFDPDTDSCINCGVQGIQLVIDPDVTNALECGPDGLYVPPAEEPALDHPFVTVAANDTPEPFKSAATFVCDGTADDVEIQAALNTYPGGQVILLPGTFNTTSTILLDADESLIGSGREATTISYNGASYIIRCVDPAGAAPGDNTIAHMTLSATAVNGACIEVEAGSERDSIYDVNCFAAGATSTNRVVFLKGSYCQFYDSTVVVAGDYYALLISGGGAYQIHHNQIHGPVAFDNNNQIWFDNNYITMPVGSGTKGAIETSTDADFHQITNNTIVGPRGHGIALGGDDNVIIGNVIRNVGGATANTYDAIRVDGDRNFVQHNYVAGSSHRYAMVVVSGTSDNNWITNNRFTAGGTGEILNSGAGTSFAPGNYPGSGGTGLPETLIIAVGDETTAITTGTAKVTFRMPFAMSLSSVRASLTTASSSGDPTVDINEAGTTILSTKLSIDATEKTSTTAAVPPVISDSALADDAEMTIDIDTAGTGAAGLKVYLIGTRV